MSIRAKEQVRLGKARYCRYLDTKRWAAFAELFGTNTIARIVDPNGTPVAEFASSIDFVAATRQFLEKAKSIHQVHNDELTMNSDDEISAIWSMEDYIVFPSAEIGPARVHGYGHYHETWIRTADKWRITRLELRRTILETTPLDTFARHAS